jgi:predicted RNA-binding protein with PUA-like domain
VPKRNSANLPRSESGNYWLIKSEPDVFSIDDLVAAPKQSTCWDGVRNYQARNTLRDQMQVGDLVLFYHSNAAPPEVAGIVRVVKPGYPDQMAFDPADPHFDPKSTPEKPTWFMVDVQFVEKFSKPLSLSQLRQMPELAQMVLLQKGSRLSVQPVRPAEFEAIVKRARL